MTIGESVRKSPWNVDEISRRFQSCVTGKSESVKCCLSVENARENRGRGRHFSGSYNDSDQERREKSGCGREEKGRRKKANVGAMAASFYESHF